MRKILVVAAAVAVLFAVVLGVALWNANRLIERYKPTLEALASDAVGAPVTLGRVKASVIPSARLEAAEVTVGGAGGVTLANLALHLRLLPLLGGRLDVVKLGLERPHVVVVRDADGIGIGGIPRRTAPPGKPAGAPTTTGDRGGPPVVALTLRAFELRDATVEYRDVVRKTTFTLSNADVDAALEVNADEVRIPTFEGGAKAEGAVVEATGKDVGYEMATGRVTIPSMVLALDGQQVRVEGAVDTRAAAGELKLSSDPLDVAKVAAAVAPLAPELQQMDPRGRATVDADARFGPGNALDASGHLVLADVAARMGANAVSGVVGTIALAATATQRTAASERLRVRVGEVPVTASFSLEATDDIATLRSLVAEAFGGTARATGTFAFATRLFTADLGADRLDLAQALTALAPARPRTLSGTLTRFAARVSGTAGDTAEATQRSIAGSGSLLLANGRYAGVNLLSEVLKALRSIPFLSAAIPGDLRRMAESDDTEIGSLQTEFTLGGAALRLAHFVLTNSALTFAGGGRVGFDRRLDLAGSAALSPHLTKSLAGGVKEVRFALDPLGRLAVPLTISGMPPNVVVVPDVAKLTTGAARAAIENQATKLLKGVLGGKKDQKGGKKDSGGGLRFRLPKF